MAPVFIAGFLAPRASYLLGGLLGFDLALANIAVLSTPALQQAATGTTVARRLQPGRCSAGAFFVPIVGRRVLRGSGGLVQALPRARKPVAGGPGAGHRQPE